MKKIFLICVPLLVLTSCGGTISSYNPYHYDNGDKYEAGNKEFSSYTNVKSIELDWDAGYVTLKGSESATSITVYETPHDYTEDRYLVHTYLDGKGKLNIKPAQSGLFSLEDTDKSFDGYKKDLTITVPSTYEFEKIRLSTYSTNFRVENITADEIKTTNTNGGNRFYNINARLLDISTWLSDINTENINVTSFISTSSFGNQELSFSKMPQSISSRASRSGNINIYLPENDGFTINCGSKSIDTDFEVSTVYTDEEDQSTRKLVYKDGTKTSISPYSLTGKIGVHRQK